MITVWILISAFCIGENKKIKHCNVDRLELYKSEKECLRALEPKPGELYFGGKCISTKVRLSPPIAMKY